MRLSAFDVFMTAGSGLMVAGAHALGGTGAALLVAGAAVWAQTLLAAWAARGA